MKKIVCLAVLVIVALAPAMGAAKVIYTFEYSTIDIAGGSAPASTNPAEDMISVGFQPNSSTTSANYTMTSVLRWSMPWTPAQNWTVYE